MLVTAVLLLHAAPDLGRAVSGEVARQECRSNDRDEVLVCGRRGRSPYRLPERRTFDPAGDTPSVMRERVAWAEEGDTGTGSCSAVGPGGWTGCTVKAWKRERDQTQWGKNVPTRRW